MSYPRKQNVSKESGFTLIEVLAALLIFSVAILGLSQASAQSARAVTALDSKMLAGIVADNQLVLARGREIEAGIFEAETTQLSRRFNYSVETRPTDIARLFQITVKVTEPVSGQVIEQRIGFTSRPTPASFNVQSANQPNLNLPDPNLAETGLPQ